jgi:hypothetical protein
MTFTSPWIADNLALLDRALAFLDAIDDDAFRLQDRHLQLAAPGSHLRHVLDFVRCVVDGIRLGRIDYDQRRRDERVERDRDFARAELATQRRRLAALATLPPTRRVMVRAESAEPDAPWSDSTFHRELMFLQSHTIHHFALIALHARRLAIDVGDDFGVAPSTLRHQAAMESLRACAP